MEKSYRAYVERQCTRNPSLTNLSRFLSKRDPDRNVCRIESLDFFKNSAKSSQTSLEVADVRSQLSQGIAKESDGALLGRLLIIEDLTRDLVEALGTTLDIDPLFFASHIHTPWKAQESFQTPDQATLPSRSRPKDYANFHYHRSLTFEKAPPGRKLLRKANVDRKVIILPGTPPRLIGLAQHCVSVLRVHRGSHWIGVILVDPPVRETYFYNDREKGLLPVECPTRLFLGGYEDFEDPSALQQDETLKPYRLGLFDDLKYYWSSSPPQFDSKNPSLMSLSYYPLRIVAAEWVKYIAVMQTSIKQYEYASKDLPNFMDELNKLHSDLRALQSWRRRTMSSQQKIQAVLRLLREWDFSRYDENRDVIFSIREDYEYLSTNMDESGRRLENMLPVVTSLVQIVDSQRSFAETANISRLTVLALIFVPLSFISSLFSMNDVNRPGGPYFWVYFVVAIPVTLLVLAFASPQMRDIPGIYRRFRNQYFRGRRAPPRNEERERALTKTFTEAYV
ncbi:MAG: hypothetical protein M1820_010046 [Bogoriella megaspora]|nr:MAG: hypothetical protein M1820_010046 [Bogoriella megaspora]